ncbi:MAG: phosphotriesterase-related protein [Syntrophaceae bacterium]|nr:phosphotriesterase-related protein [Syntrophaceae bacterium]
MKTIQSVAGPIDVASLGKTLIHEHFLFGYPGWEGDASVAGQFDYKACIQAGLQMAEKVKAHGVKTIVDATPNDMGRNPTLLKEIAEKSGLNIICASGYYSEAEGASPYFKAWSKFGDGVKQIYDVFKKETTEGIGATRIKSGVLKLASSKGIITDYERMFFKAAALVSQEEGIPIVTHTEEGTQGLEQTDLLLSAGVDPKRIMIGHICGSTNMEYLLSILEKGVYIGFDRFGIEGIAGTPKDSRREACLIGLLGMGYTSQIMISHDWVNYWLGRQGVSAIISIVMPNWKPTHLFEDVLPILEKAGVKADQVESMLNENPRRFFAGS